MSKSLKIHRPVIMEIFQRKTSLGITRKQQHRLTSLELTSDCWYTIELLIKVSKPWYAATKAISGSQCPTIGITFYIFRRLEKDFLLSFVPDDDSLFNNMKACLPGRMNDYQMVQDPPQLKIITVRLVVQYATFFRKKTKFLSVYFYAYFDPYGISVMTSNEITSTENQIKSIIHHRPSGTSIQTLTTASSNTTSGDSRSSIEEKSKKKSLLDYFLCTLNSEEEKRAKPQSSTLSKILNEEFRVYRKLATQFVSSSFDSYDPIKFWKQNKSLLPNLALLAQKYLASPSTSTKSESAFSISSYYSRKQRNQISSENLGFSVFLKDKLSD